MKLATLENNEPPFGLKRFNDNLGKNYLIKSDGLLHFEEKQMASMFSLKYVKKGVEFYRINGELHRVTAKSFLLTNPDQEIDIHIDSKIGTDGLCFYFNKDLIQQIAFTNAHSAIAHLDNEGIDDSFLLEQNCLDVIYNIPVNSSFTGIQSYFDLFDYQDFNEQKLTEMLIQVAEALVKYQLDTSKQFKKLYPATLSTRLEHYKRLQRARQYMHDNLSENISLKEIAQAALLSDYYFHRSFKCFFKVTPHQYLQNIRFQKAEDCLNKNYSRKEVAHLCGFQNPKYFSKVFNKWKNQSV